MKSFNDKNFALIFNRLVSPSHAEADRRDWRVDEVGFHRERYSFWGQAYAFSIDVYTLHCTAKSSWKLMVVRESWWSGDRRKAVRTSQWGKLVSGNKSAAMSWFRRQASRIDSRAK